MKNFIRNLKIIGVLAIIAVAIIIYILGARSYNEEIRKRAEKSKTYEKMKSEKQEKVDIKKWKDKPTPVDWGSLGSTDKEVERTLNYMLGE